MRKIYKFSLLTLFALFLTNILLAQNNFFTDAGKNSARQTTGKREIFPQKFNAFSMDVQSMKTYLWSLPSEKSINANRSNAPIIEIPMPDGTTAKFKVWESSIMEPGLALKYPEMKQFLGQGVDDPYATIRFDFNPYTGLHGQILSAKTGRVFIDPFANGDLSFYMSYFARDASSPERFVCNTEELNEPDPNFINRTEATCSGAGLRTYRLALACTGEYAVAVNGPTPSIAGVAAAMLTAVNRVTGVYEVEVAVRLMLVSNNNLLIYLDGATDPYTNNSGSAMLGQNQTNIDAIIGSANYDIGHVFSTGGGGVAGLGVVCINGNKARGVTGLPNPVGDAFYIDFVAHEIGHQYGGSHTFNSQTGNCSGGNRSASSAYEVGSGTTIQAYAGICGTDNIQNNSDPVFHARSFDQIRDYINGAGACQPEVPTGNILPVINPLPTSFTIPINTPFTLTGSATDGNGDALSYCWEEMDLGPAGAWNAGATSTTAPLFKSRLPKTTGERTFPDIAVILANYPVNPAGTLGGLKGETLATIARDIKFRLTVRDNRAGGGGVTSSGHLGCQSSTTLTVTTAGSSPFTVTTPNGGESYAGGSTQTITWDNAGTNAAPFNVGNVKITLSTDGGLTYPTVITASTPNDGSETLTIPAGITTTARIKIEAIGNIFFDISNANFIITAAANGFSFNSPIAVTAVCPAPNVMTSGNLTATYQGAFTGNINLTGSVNPAGPTVSFSNATLTTGSSSSTVSLTGMSTLSPGNYVVTVTGTGVGGGNPVQTRDITFTINPSAGPSITLQPSNQIICNGSNTSFSITSASATSFQWQLSTDGGANFNNISNTGVYSGVNTATLIITGATVGLNNNRYRCIASVFCGSSISGAGMLTVNAAPAISTHPLSVTLCAGGNQTFSVMATGIGLSYQWELSTNGCTGPFLPIGGANSSNYTINGITAGQNNTGYRCVVSGTCTPMITSNCATLTVVTSVTVTSEPSNATVCEGSNTSFTVVGSGTSIIYQWQISTDGGANYNNLSNSGLYSGTTAATLTITGATFSMNNYRYRCMMTNATCSTPGTSIGATLTVNILPIITTHPQNVTICLGSNTSFTAAATGTGINYQWQISTDGGANYNNLTNIGVHSGVTTATLSIIGATAVMNNNRYRCVATGTCPPTATTNAATLTIINPVSITTQPVASVICSGSNTSFTVVGSSTQAINYQWQVSTDGGANFTTITNSAVYSGSTSASLTITGATTSLNSYRYRCNLSNATCTVPTNSGNALLTVRQLPNVSLNAAPLTSLLPGQSTTLTAIPSVSTGGVVSTTWLYNGATPVPAITGNTYVANIEKVGTYQLLITETFSGPSLVCSNQSSIVTLTASISDRLFIFPTPNDGRFSVSYYNNGGASTKRNIVIYDSKGAQVYNREFAISGAYTLLNINMEAGNRGIYFVVVGDATGNKLAEGKVHIR